MSVHKRCFRLFEALSLLTARSAARYLTGIAQVITPTQMKTANGSDFRQAASTTSLLEQAMQLESLPVRLLDKNLNEVWCKIRPASQS
jgi:hypothetical protein